MIGFKDKISKTITNKIIKNIDLNEAIILCSAKAELENNKIITSKLKELIDIYKEA